jgi:4-diphosphocytidyl-2-C-methyl-D-erythritol kinase
MKLLSPAKINLFLGVTGKRPDGYHDLFALMCCIDLFDTILLEFDGPSIAIESSHPHIPLDETNLVHKAASLFLKTLKRTDGLKITIEKSIPVAAGLGGGSSNAASVLMGLNRHYGFPFSLEKLASMGLAIGADVPFFIFQKPAFVTGIGEKLEGYPKPLPYQVLLIDPGFQVSTGEVFRNLNLGLTKCKKKLTKAPLKKSGFDASLHMCNDLETVTASKFPVIKALKAQLMRHGAAGALMSGSGPTVFGLFSDSDKARLAHRAICLEVDFQAYLSDIINETQPIDR